MRAAGIDNGRKQQRDVHDPRGRYTCVSSLRLVRVSFWPTIDQSWDDLFDGAQHAATTGWHRLYVADHFMPKGGDLRVPLLECWAVITALAVALPRVTIGSLVSGNTYRHPAVLAKHAASVDVISGGRIVLGVGAGWQENEHVAYGIEFGTTAERFDRFEEACAILRSLVDQPFTTFAGRFYNLADAPLDPKPVGPFPLLIAGGGERRTMRIAARYADEWNAWTTPEVLARKMKVLDAHCESEGRDPEGIRRSTQALVFLSDDDAQNRAIRKSGGDIPAIVGNARELTDQLGAYAATGLDEFIVPDFTLGRGAERRDLLDRFRTEVAANFS
jgi:F420-dependent oxidoreductase-like protein